MSRERKYLSEAEVDRLLEATNRGRYPDRDRALIPIAFEGTHLALDLLWGRARTHKLAELALMVG